MKLGLCGGGFLNELQAGKTDIYGIINLAEKFGFDAVEIRNALLNNKAEDLAKIKYLLAARKLKAIYAYRVWLIDCCLLKMGEAAEMIKEAIVDAVFMESRILKVGFGPVCRKDDISDRHLETVKSFCNYAGEKGVVVCMENADRMPGGDPYILEYVLDSINSPFLKTTYDCGNYEITGCDSIKAMDIVKKHISYVHLKDVSIRQPSATYIGNGRIDFARIISGLKQIGYKGYLCLEIPVSMNRLQEVEESIELVKNINIGI